MADEINVISDRLRRTEALLEIKAEQYIKEMGETEHLGSTEIKRRGEGFTFLEDERNEIREGLKRAKEGLPPLPSNFKLATVDNQKSFIMPEQIYVGIRGDSEADITLARSQVPPHLLPSDESLCEYFDQAGSRPIYLGAPKADPLGAELWHAVVQAAFIEAINMVPHIGQRKVVIDGELVGHTDLISDWIYNETGYYRDKKQVASHISVCRVRALKMKDRQLVALLTGKMPEKKPSRTNINMPLSHDRQASETSDLINSVPCDRNTFMIDSPLTGASTPVDVEMSDRDETSVSGQADRI